MRSTDGHRWTQMPRPRFLICAHLRESVDRIASHDRPCRTSPRTRSSTDSEQARRAGFLTSVPAPGDPRLPRFAQVETGGAGLLSAKSATSADRRLRVLRVSVVDIRIPPRPPPTPADQPTAMGQIPKNLTTEARRHGEPSRRATGRGTDSALRGFVCDRPVPSCEANCTGGLERRGSRKDAKTRRKHGAERPHPPVLARLRLVQLRRSG